MMHLFTQLQVGNFITYPLTLRLSAYTLMPVTLYPASATLNTGTLNPAQLKINNALSVKKETMAPDAMIRKLDRGRK